MEKKKVILFLTSQAISLLGSSLVQYAIIWFITLKTGSGVMMTIATICGFVPQVFISLFAGVWADKYNKKMLIMVSDGIIAIATFLIALAFAFGFQNIWMLFLVLIVRSFGSGVQTPTVTAFLPEIVLDKNLMKMNGIQSTIQSLILILSPALAGALLANTPLQYIFFLDVITAILGISIFSFVKYSFKKKTQEKVKYFAAIKEGFLYTRNHKLIARIFVYLSLIYLFMAPLSLLTPLLVTRTFGADPWFLTMNEIVFFLGNIFGGVLISIWGGFKNRISTIIFASALCGIFSILIGLPISFPIYLVINLGIGLVMPFFNTPLITIFQLEVDPEKIGRVFSLVSIVSGMIMPLAMILFGPLADVISIQFILIITGIFFLVGAILLKKDKVLKNYVSEKNDDV